MCGIAGILNGGHRELLARMSDVIAHRGPDDAGLQWFPDSASGLAHRRLSIIDLSDAGHQPMWSVSGQLCLVFNGEIYNYKPLRRELEGLGMRFRSQSDSEVLLYAYQEWGTACLHRLNGMFAFAIYDARRHKLFAARDRVGIKPLYYYSGDGRFVFASEIKALFASGLVPKSPDLRALHTPARFQLSPYTGFRDVLKLPPAHWLTFENGQLTVERYWRLQPTECFPGSEGDAIEALDDLLGEAVRLQMVADVPVGVFLSGGVDSSLVSAMARRQSTGDVHSFTVRYAARDQKVERATPDEHYARRVATELGFISHEIELNPDVVDMLPRLVWHLDEPVSEPASINTYLIARAARDQNIRVLLNGMGGDEVFGGYRKHLACLTAETYQHLVPRIVRSGIEAASRIVPVATTKRGFKLARWGKRFLSFASLPPTERYLMADLSLSAGQYACCFLNGWNYDDTHFVRTQRPLLDQSGLAYLTKMCLNDTEVFLPEHNLTFTDKGTMAAGIESRPPMTDHRVLEFMFSLPPRFRFQGHTQKYLLKRVAERYLARDIVYRPKAPFASPLRAWVRGPLTPMVDDLLSESAVRARGLYDSAFVTALVARDRQGLEDNAYLIWTLLTNEIWFRTFFQH
jgi:asparagine synthase (glutamine-hydrolysing)